MSCDLKKPSDQSAMWLYIFGTPQVKSPPCQVGGHRHCVNRDITYLVCDVTWQDHVAKGSCEFMGGNAWWHLPRQLNPRFMWLNELKSLMLSHNPAKFGGQGHSSSADIPSLDCQVMCASFRRAALFVEHL